jgi:anaerobic magnesium-protoporphyrin IX monomethyl ester cyclase
MDRGYILGLGEGRPDLILVNSPLRNYDRAPRLNDFTLPTLGLGYIATYAEAAGFNVGLLDVEAGGLGIAKACAIINEAAPRWVGLNLLAPTYRYSVEILRGLDPAISVMLGGHQAKAMPGRILADAMIPRIDALVLGEAETRVPKLLERSEARALLPRVHWREDGKPRMPDVGGTDRSLLAPDVNGLFLDRKFLPQDPYRDGEVIESAVVGSRGCPFDCSFCGAAISANPDVSIRTRRPDHILAEIEQLKDRCGVQRVRFVDDLFLANRKVISETLRAFIDGEIGIQWDATGRINVLAAASNELLELLVESGCREIALGIESGSDRLLQHIDKKISVAQINVAVRRLCAAGINVKGYFILGLPTETREEHYETLTLIRSLWQSTERLPGRFRCSVFEYRPYPGTPDWGRLAASGFDEDKMLLYEPDERLKDIDWASLAERDEFNFSTGMAYGEVPVPELRANLATIMGEQKARMT